MIREGDDVSLGFADYPWHTHGDILASLLRLPVEDAIERFVRALLSNQAVIAVARVNGIIRDVWVAELPLKPDPTSPAMRQSASGYGTARRSILTS